MSPTKKKSVSKESIVKSLNKKIEKDNKAFDALSPSEKRVAIARDVLAQLASKRFTAKFGVWFGKKNNSNLFSDRAIEKDLEVKDVISEIKQCDGCAIGGMFMCAVDRADKLKISELTYHNNEISEKDSFDYLRRFFSADQLNLIESVFERNEGAKFSDGAENFAPGLDSASERMRLIMENIIVNKGTFKLNKLPVAVYTTPGFTG